MQSLCWLLLERRGEDAENSPAVVHIAYNILQAFEENRDVSEAEAFARKRERLHGIVHNLFLS